MFTLYVMSKPFSAVLLALTIVHLPGPCLSDQRETHTPDSSTSLTEPNLGNRRPAESDKHSQELQVLGQPFGYTIADERTSAVDKRAREFVGKRAREFVGKRAREFVGKRAREFVGKRAREFVGKRAPGYEGNINDREMYPEEEDSFLFLTDKRPRHFVGKRSVAFVEDELLELDKRAREFVGKRGDLIIDLPQADDIYIPYSDEESEILDKRSREFVGKRYDADPDNFVTPMEKRPRQFVGKRSSDGSLTDDAARIEVLANDIYRRLVADSRENAEMADLVINDIFSLQEPQEKRAREFVGKRAREFVGKRAREFVGKRLVKRPRQFVGKRSVDASRAPEGSR